MFSQWRPDDGDSDPCPRSTLSPPLARSSSDTLGPMVDEGVHDWAVRDPAGNLLRIRQN